jgi:hypothetical protein
MIVAEPDIENDTVISFGGLHPAEMGGRIN